MQFKRRKQILIALLALNLFSALNFIFLNSFSSAYISLFAILEMLINYAFEKRKQEVPKLLVAAYFVINIILGTLTFSGPLDVLPIVCAILFCITILLKNEQNIRYTMLANQVLWLLFDVAVGAYMFAISNVLTIVSTSIAIFRYRNKTPNKRSKNGRAK